MEAYAAYLTVLDQLTCALEQLSILGRRKLAAVQNDDLDALNQILTQEQALSLTVRSLEHKRLTAQGEAHLADVPVARLAEQYPEDMRQQAKETVNRLREQYRIYQGVSEVARNALECGLHEIEKILSGMGAGSADGVGYMEHEAELPAKMRTDIRA